MFSLFFPNQRHFFWGVSAWASTRASLSCSLIGRRRQHGCGAGFASSGATLRSQTAALFLNVRGGTNSNHWRNNVNAQFLQQTRNLSVSSSAREASVIDESASTKRDLSFENNNDDLSFYKESLKLDLPVLNFGGLSYWKTTGWQSVVEGGNDGEQKERRKFRVLFVLGGPGAGKGTQSELMSENYPVVHLSVGELLRKEQTNDGSPHQKLIQEALVAGKIVPVQVSLGLLQKAMEEASAQAGEDILFLVDGFPRNEDNLSGWCHYMGKVASIWSVLVYQCPLQVLEQRLLERAKNSGRSDDNLESIRKRFNTFEMDTMPIIRKLAIVAADSPWCVIEISGNQSLDDVWLSTQQALNQLIRHDVLTANAELLQAVEKGDVQLYQKRCDPLWFQKGLDAATVMKKQEGLPAPIGTICDPELEFVTGKHVAVSYTRTMEGEKMREKRIWVFQGLSGWRNVHFARTPVM